jgi:N-acetyl-anhydromuramyl-L-alanine amidase AmpD
MDFGVTLEFIKRITFNINWYNRRTDQALLDVPIATSSGFSSLKRNIGVLQNRGIELGMNATKKTIEAFQYHFRPQNYDGKIDIETWAILQALIQKYPNK